jgi:hypothetical protein
MRIELLVVPVFAVTGLIAAGFPRQVSDFLIAGNYVISRRRGNTVSAGSGPRTLRILGILFVAFSVFIVLVPGSRTPRRPSGPPDGWHLVLPLALATLIALSGITILLLQRRLAAIAARRVIANGGELYCGPDPDRFARLLVRITGAWHLVIAAIVTVFAFRLFLWG